MAKYRVVYPLKIVHDIAHPTGAVVDSSVLEGHPEWADRVEPVEDDVRSRAPVQAPLSGEVEPVPDGQSPSAERSTRKAKE